MILSITHCIVILLLYLISMKNIVNVLFQWWGRISRKQYLIGLLLSWVLVVLFVVIIGLLISKKNVIGSMVVFPILRVAVAYISINLIIKRLHDLWKQWSNVLLILIPFFNIYYFFKLLIEKWEDKQNQYWKVIAEEKKIPVIMRVIICIVWLWILIGGSIFSILWIIKNSEAYQLSLQEINTNSAITDIYWKFDVWFMPMWSISTSWPDGNASLQIKVQWEKNNGSIYVNLLMRYWKREIINMVSVNSETNQQYIIWSGNFLSPQTEE